MGTTHYNLTQPLSTDRFNLQVWNDNLEQIDQRMYLNQTTTFNGATELVAGSVGNVPAPQTSDKEKFLKGDGTWDTPQGGGGGSTVTITPTLSSGTKIADYSIDGVSDSLYAPSGGGGGGSHTYSTTEQIVGTWIDGSDIYERTVVVDSAISQGNYATIISGENIDLLGINSDGCFLTRSNGQRWSIFGGYSGSGLLIYQETNGDIKLYNNSGVDFTNATITVTYLK